MNVPLSVEAKAERAAYMREWRKANKDKARNYSATYWERRAAKAVAQSVAAEAAKESEQ